MTGEKKQKEKAAEYTKVEGCPSKKDLPAADRKANLVILPGRCCVLKDGCAGCALHKNLRLSGKRGWKYSLLSAQAKHTSSGQQSCREGGLF